MQQEILPASPSAGLQLDSSLRLHGRVLLSAPFRVYANVTLNRFSGDAFSYIAPGCSLHRVSIGRYCSIGDGVTILSAHPTDGLTTSPFPYQQVFPAPFDPVPQHSFDNLLDTRIGNDVWIGSGTRLKSGVSIGDSAIIGAGSVVTRDIPPFTVCGGVPCRVIRPRFDDTTAERIAALAWWQFNLLGLALPWNNLPAVIERLEAMAADGMQPYASRPVAVWREGAVIKGQAAGDLPS